MLARAQPPEALSHPKRLLLTSRYMDAGYISLPRCHNPPPHLCGSALAGRGGHALERLRWQSEMITSDVEWL